SGALLMVHSPLVGPSTMTRFARQAEHAGHQVALPDLTSIAAGQHSYEQLVARAVEAAGDLSGSVMVVGHSGAGVFLPAIGEQIGDDVELVFVDAVVPPRTGAHHTSEAMRGLLDAHTVDGVLRPWLQWWPNEVVDHLVPDAADRAQLEADMPQIPRSFYDADVDVPAGWSQRSCAYLRLSPAYDDDYVEAASRGWPTASIDSTHLGLFTDAARVFAATITLVDELSEPAR
ncbi:MAG: hypothetical protein AAFY28_16915, partial [Actinomycetota bacterium]